jgi:hypothetical protein
MTNEQIAGMIVNAYKMGRSDGQYEGYKLGFDAGYEEGYERAESEGDQTAFDKGYEKGYEIARDEFEVVVELYDDEGEDEKEDKGEMGSSPVYDIGWNDGYEGKDPDEEMKEDRGYMWGYKEGRVAYGVECLLR